VTFLLQHILLHKTDVHLHGDDHSQAWVKLSNAYKVFFQEWVTLELWAHR